MNSAFAIGRLCDFEAGCKRMLSLKTSDIMVNIGKYVMVNISNKHIAYTLTQFCIELRL